MRTIAIINQKGGCGKTTTAINLASILARRGLRTLLVDLDQQAHCAAGLGVPEARIEYSIADALLAEHDEHFDPSPLVWEVGRNLHLAPSTMRLAALEAPDGGLHERPDKDRRLASLLERFEDRYERCLIDCPPTIGLLTYNALRAAREALIPVETGFFALRGAEKQWKTIQRMIERIGRPIACHLLPTLHDAESELSEEILAALRRRFAGQIVPLVVHEHEELRAATSFGQSVSEYAPRSPACLEYEQLADWLEDHAPHRTAEIEIVRAEPSTAADPDAPSIRPAAAPLDETEFGPPMPSLVPVGAPAPDERTPAPALSPVEVRDRLDRAAELAERMRVLARRSAAATVHQVFTTVQAAPRPAADEAPPAASPLAAREEAELAFGALVDGTSVRFVQPGHAPRRIFVAGDFNSWSTLAHPLAFDAARGVYEASLSLPAGRYQYRLVIDGRWQEDPYNDHQSLNAYGEPNSVLIVPDSTSVR